MKIVSAASSDRALNKSGLSPHIGSEPALRADVFGSGARHHADDYKEYDAKQRHDIDQTLNRLGTNLPARQRRIQQGGVEVEYNDPDEYELDADEYVVTWTGPTPYELFCGKRLIPIFTFFTEQYFDSTLKKIANEMIEWAYHDGGNLHRYQMDTLVVHSCIILLSIKLKKCLEGIPGVYCDDPNHGYYRQIPQNMRIPRDWRNHIPDYIQNAFNDRNYFNTGDTVDLLWFYNNFYMYVQSKFGIQANLFEVLDFWYNEHNGNLGLRFYPRLLLNIYWDLTCYAKWFLTLPKRMVSREDMDKAYRILNILGMVEGDIHTYRVLDDTETEIGQIVNLTAKAFRNEINCAYSYRMLAELKDITPNY